MTTTLVAGFFIGLTAVLFAGEMFGKKFSNGPRHH